MSALSKILGTAANLSNPGNIISGAAYAATHGKIGSDITPGYSATNVVRTQAGKVLGAHAATPAPAGNPATWGVGAQGAGSGTYAGDSGYGSQSGYGSDAAAQAQDQALAEGLRQQITSRIQNILQTYDALNSAVDSTVKDKAGQLRTNYGNQTTNLNNSYSDTANQLAGNFSNRGLGDSSYAGNAQDSATRTYNTNLQSINQAENSDLANLGQYANSAHAQYNAAKESDNSYVPQLGNYATPDLQTLFSNLGGDLSNAQTQLGGQGTQGQFLSSVNAIAPVQNGGAGDLQSQLQSVLSSAAPGFAKQAIGQGLITQASNGDPAAQDYYNKLFQQLQTTSNTGK